MRPNAGMLRRCVAQHSMASTFSHVLIRTGVAGAPSRAWPCATIGQTASPQTRWLGQRRADRQSRRHLVRATATEAMTPMARLPMALTIDGRPLLNRVGRTLTPHGQPPTPMASPKPLPERRPPGSRQGQKCLGLHSRSGRNSIDPFRSANSTVTGLRSPSSALREVKMFSAGCAVALDSPHAENRMVKSVPSLLSKVIVPPSCSVSRQMSCSPKDAVCRKSTPGGNPTPLSPTEKMT
jgi:hypothetical protein